MFDFSKDETGMRVEEVPRVIIAHKGAKQVPKRTTGKERQMFTVWLSTTTEWTGTEWVCGP